MNGKKVKTYVIALIDDASRMVVDAQIFFNDNFVNLMNVIRSAVSKYGKGTGRADYPGVMDTEYGLT